MLNLWLDTNTNPNKNKDVQIQNQGIRRWTELYNYGKSTDKFANKTSEGYFSPVRHTTFILIKLPENIVLDISLIFI